MNERPSRLALHACCAPCLIEPYDAFARDDLDTVVVFANPNIHPASEYERRRDTLFDYARAAGIEAVEIACDPQAWHSAVEGAGSRAERCAACYRLRLGLVARWAAEHGCDAVATTLTVSPYQDGDSIAEQGEAVAVEAGVEYLHRDFRDRYSEATRRSRERGMYRQSHCGCAPSIGEADEERARARARRAAATRADAGRTGVDEPGRPRPEGVE